MLSFIKSVLCYTENQDTLEIDKNVEISTEKVKESKDGLMRTVKIKYRAKRKSKLLPNVSVPLTSMDVAIQRLVFVVPSEAGEGMEDEAWNQGWKMINYMRLDILANVL